MRTAAPADSPLLSDEDLMRRVKADDADAFEELDDRYSSRAFGLAFVICNSSERAEEAVQDAFVSVWRTRARYDEGRGASRTGSSRWSATAASTSTAPTAEATACAHLKRTSTGSP